jgi:hypothetical protein
VSGNLGTLTVKGSIVGHDGEQAIVAVGGKAPRRRATTTASAKSSSSAT